MLGIRKKRCCLWVWRDVGHLPASHLQGSDEHRRFSKGFQGLQVFQLTSFLDGSAIYGNLEVQSLELRDLYSDHGLLRFDIVSEAQKPYLPFEKDSEMDCRRNFSEENPIRCFLAGDFRANEQVSYHFCENKLKLDLARTNVDAHDLPEGAQPSRGKAA